MKSYTDIEQSKKLAEFLPIESADMNWHELSFTGFFARAFPYKLDNGATEGLFPCWSLAALLDVLPRIEDLKPVLDLEINYIQYPSDIDLSATADNAVDACVEMILKLHELKML